jgi:NHS family xanthosine MFS transporter
MSLKLRLTIMQFLQFFIWGSWLLSIGAYWFQNKQWSGTEFGAVFSTIGIASLFMPAIAGIIADRWMNAERLYGLLHLCGAAVLFAVPLVGDPSTMFWVMLLNMIFYMPTLSLSITVSYAALKEAKLDIVKDYPSIRVWGTVGFIAALWTIDRSGFAESSAQFYVASAVSFALAIYALTMPKCPPQRGSTGGSWVDALGLRAFSLFKNPQMARFFVFAMLLGAALQLTNAYGGTFLRDFASDPLHQDAFAVRNPLFILSISQFSEVAFILAIPFFLRRFGMKQVMFFSAMAWVLRFGLFAFGDPSEGLWMIVLSCIIYGMAFDFFNISGSMFVESQVEPSLRASGQGLFMMMSNGFGAVIGSVTSGFVIDRFFIVDGQKDWQGIWIAFAAYAAVIAVLFLLFFRKTSADPTANA